MKIGNTYSLNQINTIAPKQCNKMTNLNKRCAVSFYGKVYSNKLLDELLKPLGDTELLYIAGNKIILKQSNLSARQRIAEAIKDKNIIDKKVFERELVNRAMELYPKLRNYRMEEYKDYYNKNEFRPPLGKIGLLKQDASDYANRKLIELLTERFV